MRRAILALAAAALAAGCGEPSKNEQLVEASLKKLGDGGSYEANVDTRIRAEGENVTVRGRAGVDGTDEVGEYTVRTDDETIELELNAVDGEQYATPPGEDAWQPAQGEIMSRPLLEPAAALKLVRDEGDIKDKGVTEIRGRDTRFLQARIDARDLVDHVTFGPLAKQLEKHGDVAGEIPTYVNVFIDERDKSLVRQQLSMLESGMQIASDADYLSFGEPIDVEVPTDLAEG